MAATISAAELNAYITPFSPDDAGARTRYEWRDSTGGAGEPRSADGGLFPRLTPAGQQEDGPLVVFSPANIGKRVFEILDDTKVVCRLAIAATCLACSSSLWVARPHPRGAVLLSLCTAAKISRLTRLASLRRGLCRATAQRCRSKGPGGPECQARSVRNPDATRGCCANVTG